VNFSTFWAVLVQAGVQTVKGEIRMNRVKKAQIFLQVLALVTAGMLVPAAQADLLGTVPTAPGDTVFPGLIAPGTDPGTLLDSLSVDFFSTLGTYSGTLVSAVYRETGTGTLDFYYQVTNNLTAPNCGGAGQDACDAIARETDTDFSGFSTATGFWIDGSSLPGGIFVDGTVAPVTADRNGGVGNVVGFSFNPPDPAKIQPGQISNVLVISTNATNYTSGNASVIDGGVTTVEAFQPTTAVTPPIPEVSSFFLLGGALLALFAIRRFQVQS